MFKQFKKIFAFAIIALSNITLASSCAKKCDHFFQLVSNTATCENGGENTYKCNKCGETKKESSNALGHKWDYDKFEGTCGVDGKRYYKCKNCQKSKFEEITNHDYNAYGECRNCHKKQYTINPNVTLPAKLNHYGFSGNLRTSCTITKIHYETHDNGYLYIFFYGSKTYDYDGNAANNSVSFNYILKDQNGKILDSNEFILLNLVVGQEFGEHGYKGYKSCHKSKLETDGVYTLELHDNRP